MRAFLLGILFAGAAVAAQPTPTAPDAAALTTLLREFLDGASRNDAAVHEAFWAEDLVYTGSGGRRIGKAQLMSEVRAAPALDPTEPAAVYTAEDVQIQQYDDAALVAFRLVATTAAPDSTRVSEFLNTGFFMKRGDRWQAVGWQATRKP